MFRLSRLHCIPTVLFVHTFARFLKILKKKQKYWKRNIQNLANKQYNWHKKKQKRWKQGIIKAIVIKICTLKIMLFREPWLAKTLILGHDEFILKQIQIVSAYFRLLNINTKPYACLGNTDRPTWSFNNDVYYYYE